MSDATPPPASDVLTGCEAIARHLEWTVRQVKHRVATGELPTFRIGRTVCARRSTLAKHFAAQEAAAAAAARDA